MISWLIQQPFFYLTKVLTLRVVCRLGWITADSDGVNLLEKCVVSWQCMYAVLRNFVYVYLLLLRINLFKTVSWAFILLKRESGFYAMYLFIACLKSLGLYAILELLLCRLQHGFLYAWSGEPCEVKQPNIILKALFLFCCSWIYCLCCFDVLVFWFSKHKNGNHPFNWNSFSVENKQNFPFLQRWT